MHLANQSRRAELRQDMERIDGTDKGCTRRSVGWSEEEETYVRQIMSGSVGCLVN